MPSEVRVKLAAEASMLAKQPQTSVTFLTYRNLTPDPDRDYVERVLTKLRELFTDEEHRTKWEFPNETLEITIGDIVGSRIQIRELDKPTRFQSLKKVDADDRSRETADTSMKLKDRYNESIGFLLKIVSLMRQSSKISDQDRSDWLESFLLRECLQEDSNLLLEPASYNRMVDQLSDHEGRYQARRRAILLSWHRVWENPREIVLPIDGKSKKPDYRPTLGGYPLYHDNRWAQRKWFFNTLIRKASFVAYEMLECLELGRMTGPDHLAKNSKHALLARDELQRRVGVAWSSSSVAYREADKADKKVFGDYEYYLPQSPMPTYFIHSSHIPCDQWFGEWERVAGSLEKR